jgi:DNA-directed RNA polymerase subunit M
LRFCPKCDTRLRHSPGDEDQIVCSKCGFKTKATKEVDRKAEQFNNKVNQDVSLKVMDGDTVEALPTTSIECPECKNNTAFWWMLQTRSADEATTQFYRCTKCNHTWRNYS